MSDKLDDITSVRLRWCTWSEIRPIIMKKTWHLTEERANSSRAFLLMIVRICLLSNLGVELEVYWILTCVSTLSKLTFISTKVLISALHPYLLPAMFAYLFQSGFWGYLLGVQIGLAMRVNSGNEGRHRLLCDNCSARCRKGVTINGSGIGLWNIN